MNREIKFRAWDKNCNAMREVRAIEWDGHGGVDVDYSCDKMSNFAGGPDTLMQFTGLKDKNGKEIYEHDIVIISTKYPKKKVAQIIGRDWETGGWCFTYDTGEAMRDITRGEKGVLEVIGNIYENPELLK